LNSRHGFDAAEETLEGDALLARFSILGIFRVRRQLYLQR
jgi:hypothetical protein